jgi:hypothetical protein
MDVVAYLVVIVGTLLVSLLWWLGMYGIITRYGGDE